MQYLNHLKTKSNISSHDLFCVCRPFKQHQLFVDCLRKLQHVNGTDTEVKGHIWRVAPNTSPAWDVVSHLLWALMLCLPVFFIIESC
jgi:hypothetical protein